MAYKIDTCHFLAWLLALIGLGKDLLAQCQDNVLESGGGELAQLVRALACDPGNGSMNPGHHYST